MLQAFFREYTVGASMQKPSKLPPLSAFNTGRVLPLQSKRVAHISYFVLCLCAIQVEQWILFTLIYFRVNFFLGGK